MAGLDGEIRGGRHFMPVRVYYEDTDFSGIVYHASYLRFMERGRTNYLRLLGAAARRPVRGRRRARQPGFAFVVRSMQIEFLKPARMDDVLEVVTAPAGGEGASITLRQRVMRGDELLVEARVRVACVSGGRARPIPKPLRLAMQADRDTHAGPGFGRHSQTSGTPRRRRVDHAGSAIEPTLAGLLQVCARCMAPPASRVRFIVSVLYFQSNCSPQPCISVWFLAGHEPRALAHSNPGPEASPGCRAVILAEQFRFHE